VMRFRGDETEKAFLNRIIADTRLLMENNEYVVGLENLISNLYEVEFKIDEKGIQLVKESIKSCGLDYNDWRFVEELKK